MGEKRVTQQVASDEIYNDDWFLKDSVLHDTTKVQPSVIKEYVNQGMATSQDLADEATARQNMDSQLASGIGQQMANLADFYDTTKSYVVGDVCVLQSGELLRCIAPTSGTFDNTKWEQVTVDELFDDLNFSAEAISYDNTSSGLESDNVQDAIDETITKLSAVGSASGDIATFTDGSDLPMPKLEVAIEPVQDLHGYDSPWVGGAGKNKFDSDTVLSAFTKNNNKYVGMPSYVVDDYVISGGFKTNTRYTLSYKAYNNTSTSSNFRFVFSYTDGTEEIIGGFVDTTTEKVIVGTSAENKTISKIKRSYGNGVELTLYNIQLEEGSTATTFAPYSNICPISGWDEVNVGVSGKNLCKSTIHGYVSSSDDSIIIDNDSESAIFYAQEGQTYTISSSATMNKSRVALVGTDNVVNYTPILQKEILSDNVNTWTATWTGWTVWYKCGNRQTAFDSSAQLEIGDTPTTYEPYNGQTYTLDLDGTRYGGKVDLVSGVLTVDRKYLTIDNFNSFGGSGTSAGGLHWCDVRNEIEGKSGNKNICSICGYVQNGWTSTITVMSVGISETIPVRIYDSSESLSDFKDKYPNLQIVYELATPLTIQLTPTVVKSLRGMNNVWGDSGAILDAEYIRDLTTVLDSLPTFTDLTATLSAGSTSLTINNSVITTNSTIDIYTNKYGVNPTNMTVSNGSIVLTFVAQSSAVSVKVRVS